MTDSVGTEKTNKLSRRKRARAKKTLHNAFYSVLKGIETDQLLRSHLFLSKIGNDKLIIGSCFITKTRDHLYHVYQRSSNNLLYEGLFTLDAAIAIAESTNIGKNHRADTIVDLDKEVSRHYGDMCSFKNSFRSAIQNKTGNEAIFEARYFEAKDKASRTLRDIRRYRTIGK